MTEPIIFISRFRVKEGKLDDFVNLYHERIPRTEAEKPRTLAQLGFVNPEGTHLSITRFFADPEAFDQQMSGADERSKAVYELVELVGIEIHGTPGEKALEMIQRTRDAGVEVKIYPQYIGGFLHLIE